MNTINKKQFKQYIEVFDFTGLFNQLGWTWLDEQTPIKLKEETYLFNSVAEKGGFRIMVLDPSGHHKIPNYATRLELDRKIGKLFREHLIIFCDKNNSVQLWQLFVKQQGKPSRLSETRWHKGQEPELLYQKTSNLFFTLDQEENITITDVVDVVNENFSKNVEQVTKKFYENFRKEHRKFFDFISGISAVTDREWYASLMLNRLMFCYFIQKKGFLDNNFNYLKEKLIYCENKKGKDQFYVSFYKNFLLAMFHQGLGSPDQNGELIDEIGKIPYLNGGLFDIHELEKQYENIDISDEAFENIFHFFDQYNWHLDTRVTASGKDVNPDVIGYIFEKYINDRAQMGAYYTKEDITDYIAKNCIVPFLFDETERKYPKAFKAEAELWQILKDSGDTYIYDALKKGVELALPEEIERGQDTGKPDLLERRKEWNKTAPGEYALPTEIWRETVDRRKRCADVKTKIENGEICHINDFITYNLNIRQFAQDVIDNHGDPDFIRHFYDALSSVTILDPTCGSGAFLFAAMNILEPMYESCIQRMENFTEEAPKGKYRQFEEILKYVKAPEHPNLKYFVFKNIILRNLYGVDIMKEAVEIAKLRLFLKLVATVEADYSKPNLGLEPLPDIDFNIRSGNTLVGFASETELLKNIQVDATGQYKTGYQEVFGKISEKCDIVARAFERYKTIQLTEQSENYSDFKSAKDDLNQRLNTLNHELNILLCKDNGIDYDKNNPLILKSYESWFRQHQPFHWFSEFYEIIHDKGGFDVVIGNPPYVVYSEKKIDYKIFSYQTFECKNLYAFVIERALSISNNRNIGFIIPSAAFGTPATQSLRKTLIKGKVNSYISYLSGDAHPAVLFEGVKLRLSILLANSFKNNENQIFTTKFLKWYSEERHLLFEAKMGYTNSTKILDTTFPKTNSEIEKSIISKIKLKKKLVSYILLNNSKFIVHYHNAPVFFIRSMNFVPYFKSAGSNEPSSNHFKTIYCNNSSSSEFLLSLLNSSIFFFWFTNYSANRDVTSYDILNFPLFNVEEEIEKSKLLAGLNKKLMKDIDKNSVIREYDYSTGKVEYQEFYMRLSKPIIDEIDAILAKHYGLTNEELDFIINYDIKYRMGKELDNEEEEE